MLVMVKVNARPRLIHVREEPGKPSNAGKAKIYKPENSVNTETTSSEPAKDKMS